MCPEAFAKSLLFCLEGEPGGLGQETGMQAQQAGALGG